MNCILDMEKSVVFFSINTSSEARTEICTVLEGIKEQRNNKYIGLPMVFGRSKKQVFNFIKQRVEAKVNNWKNRFLSPTGKEVLIKSVALALPVYSMSCFRLPKGLCEGISKVLANLWWGQKDKEQKLHWMGWNKLTKRK